MSASDLQKLISRPQGDATTGRISWADLGDSDDETRSGTLVSESCAPPTPLDSSSTGKGGDLLRSQEPSPSTGESSDDVASVGSVGHTAGECRPCFLYTRRQGCSAGASCLFCHLSHASTGRSRPCKRKRAVYKKLQEENYLLGERVEEVERGRGERIEVGTSASLDVDVFGSDAPDDALVGEA
eukprot:CAMPEP_0176216304 /NCGR_PEP_ID=MMETSP0121_2-20121125/17123_1 /TAXON_ID=160619 /ORGANISM="Kryptoperidinium foliaceum, Strain CCMP 1326" /LENGTH=183 /DNA_ID=CAMNT_0017555429 /DNA_START=77 /DNA_END=628 /DNA_ORIENTATION=+